MEIELDPETERILEETVKIYNRNNNAEYTKENFLKWILSRWFSKKGEEYGISSGIEGRA